jgi:hypothetical protein
MKKPYVGLNIEKKSVFFSFVVDGGLLKISSSFEAQPCRNLIPN